jgi:hypothetical protein
MAQKNRGAHGKAADHAHDGHHELGPGGHGGHVRRLGKFSYDQQIHRAVHGLQKQRKEDRQRKAQKRPQYLSLCQIQCLVHCRLHKKAG